MRILQLCHKKPFPSSDGGSIAMHQITRGLLDLNHQVKVVAIDTEKNNNSNNGVPKDYARETGFEAYFIDTRVKLFPALRNLFSSRSYNVERFFNHSLERRLRDILQQQQYDIIQLEGLYLTPYIDVIRRYSSAPVIFRSHNIEHFIWERMATASGGFLKKKYLDLLARRLKNYEMQVIHKVDGLVAISPIDLDFFCRNGFDKPSVFIPVGIPELPDQPTEIAALEDSVYHIGSMDWRPNQEAVEWFLDNVWPHVIVHKPKAVFHLAGKNMPRRFFRYAGPNINVAGEVPDAKAFFRPLEVMVVPLLSGGGMRVKIIEGMAWGKTIVSTSIGAEGIGCSDGENILLADDPLHMAQKVVECLDNKQLARNIGLNAREFVKANYATESLMKNLVKFYREFYPQ
jgi:polysaccharide biosynthesis protein PslH